MAATPAEAKPSPCDAVPARTVAQNASWRVITYDLAGTQIASCDRTARGPVRFRSLVPPDRSGAAVELAGDRVLLTTSAGRTTYRRLLDLREGAAGPATPDAWWNGSGDARESQTVTTAFTAAGALAWTSYEYRGKQRLPSSGAIDGVDGGGLFHLPFDALLVTAAPTSDSIYVRRPDLSVQLTKLGTRPPRLLFQADPSLRARHLKLPATKRPPRAAESRELVGPRGDAYGARWDVVRTKRGATVRATDGARIQRRWALAPGGFGEARSLAVGDDVAVVRARFADDPQTVRVRVLVRTDDKPRLDIPAAELSPGETVAVVPGWGPDWAVSTRNGVIAAHNAATRNVGHPGAYDLASIVSAGWSLYLTDAGQPFRIPVEPA
ncbi:MAG: hypothetical protein J7513_11040 [Solirubrobacteraceae bacterium]|nr:hypothetical protein [Solirubrobacteraceae bacterium]